MSNTETTYGACTATITAGYYTATVVYLDKQYLYWRIKIDDLYKVFSHSTTKITIQGPTVTDGEYNYGELQLDNCSSPYDFKPTIRKIVGDGFKDTKFIELSRNAGDYHIELLLRIKRLNYGEQRLCSSGISYFKTQADLGEVLKNGELADFTISVSEEEIPAHKVVLAQSSEYFKALLSTDMKESRTNRLEIVDQKLPVIEAMLKYIYTSEIEKSHLSATIHESVNFYTDLFMAAEMYQLDRLKSICEEILCELVTEESVGHLEVFAFEHELKMLRKMVAKFIVDQKDGSKKN